MRHSESCRVMHKGRRLNPTKRAIKTENDTFVGLNAFDTFTAVKSTFRSRRKGAYNPQGGHFVPFTAKENATAEGTRSDKHLTPARNTDATEEK